MASQTPEQTVSAAAPFSLTMDAFIPEVLRRYPQAREVLDRHGLRGCGGPNGPHESLEFFAKAHGVDGPALMDELRMAVSQGANHRADRAVVGPADRIYRPFFLGGIAVVLTLGGVWGAWLLWQIGVAGRFHAVSVLEINAHGHAMIFGWVGLFIMGFAMQALPRMWHVELPAPRLAVGSFAVMLGGIIIRTVAMAASGQVWAAPVALGGGLLEIAAIVAVSVILLLAFLRSESRTEPYMVFILAGLGWFNLQAVFGLWHIWMTMTAASEAQLLWYVSAYQSPLRDMQIHGLALFMILGVSLRIFPAFFGLPRVSDRRVWTGLILLTVAVLAEIGFFITFRWTGDFAFVHGLYAAWLMLAAGVVVVVWPWKLWRPLPTHDRCAKFVRIAYGWLAVSLAMLLLLPLYQYLNAQPFSHAYYGAIRHAVTVGFISMMIMGVAAKVIPTLTGRDPRTLSSLWGPFLLVNIGCFLRVSLQTLTDWSPSVYPFIGLSGTLEVIGLAWWGGHLAYMMLVPAVAEFAEADGPPQQISGDHRVADVLRWYPHALDVFEQFGFNLLRRAMKVRAFATNVTIGQAANARGVALEPLLAALNGLNKPAGVLRYDASLAELMQRFPVSAQIFARYGLNLEGHGSMTLEQAAERTAMTKDALLLELAQIVLSGNDTCSGQCGHGCGNCQDHAVVRETPQ